jgi:heme/copper-type cytochrome/quinol oxidase subunit 3
MILPAFGMISEMIPVFSRKPLFGYTFVAFSGVAIGFISFIVWAHHMFTTGLTETEQAFFAATSMIIAVPTGVKIFNWLGTMWRGAIWWTTAMKFAAAFIIEFTIGGISGVMFSVVPLDYASSDTYFVVAHFHYVLFGGTLFILMGASYYWFPKITGRLLSETLGTWQFWLTVVGFNLTFFPQHFLVAMPRRVYTYTNPEWALPNLMSSIGAGILFIAFSIFFYNLWISLRHGKRAGPNPWNGYTLEWALPSPPPAYGFVETPVVRSRRPLWDLAHPDMADWRDPHHAGAAPARAPAARPVPEPSGAVATAVAAPQERRAGFHLTPARMLVLFFISSESIFFVSLIVMYSVYSFHFTSKQLDIPRTYWFSIALFASSGTMIMAERFLSRGNKKMFVSLLIATIALGATFLIGQVTEYAKLYSEKTTISAAGEFGTTFFTLTGFHGFHVFVGLIALSTILLLSRDWTHKHDTPVRAVGYYWHFVDGVWVFIFSIVYLRTLL